MSKKTNGGIFGSRKKKAKALNTVEKVSQVPERVTIIVVGEDSLVETETSIKSIDDIANDPLGAKYDDEQLGYLIGKFFDNGAAEHDEELGFLFGRLFDGPDADTALKYRDTLQNRVMPIVACYLGRNPVYHRDKAECHTFVVCAWRDQHEGYSVVVMSYVPPPDKHLIEIVRDGVGVHLDKLETVGFDPDSHYHDYAAPFRAAVH